MPKTLDETAFHLFRLFAQYEYALKAMGYAKASRTGTAEPDWDRFAKEIGVKLLAASEPSVVAARDYLLREPPRRQVLVNGEIAWADVSNSDHSAHALFGHIRRVRNNLYHGGKFNGRWFAPDRSRPLMDTCIILLDALKMQDAVLREAIEGNAA